VARTHLYGNKTIIFQFEWKVMTMEVKDILLSKITISDLNVRKNLDSGHEDSTLENLADSISARAGRQII
jgi:hypothetical protein